MLDEHIAYLTSDAALTSPFVVVLPRARGAAGRVEGPRQGAARARHRPARDQEAGGGCRPRRAAPALEAPGSRVGDPAAHAHRRGAPRSSPTGSDRLWPQPRSPPRSLARSTPSRDPHARRVGDRSRRGAASADEVRARSRRRAASPRCTGSRAMPSTIAHTATARLSSGRRSARIARDARHQPDREAPADEQRHDEADDDEGERPAGEAAVERAGSGMSHCAASGSTLAAPGSAGADSTVTATGAVGSRWNPPRCAPGSGDASSARATSGDTDVTVGPGGRGVLAGAAESRRCRRRQLRRSRRGSASGCDRLGAAAQRARSPWTQPAPRSARPLPPIGPRPVDADSPARRQVAAPRQPGRRVGGRRSRGVGVAAGSVALAAAPRASQDRGPRVRGRGRVIRTVGRLSRSPRSLDDRGGVHGAARAD